MELNSTPPNPEAIIPRYIAYQCKPSTEVRGRRDTHGRGCLQWSVRRCKTTIYEWPNKIQMSCPNCGNRPRVAEYEVYIFDHKAAAIEYSNLLNERDE